MVAVRRGPRQTRQNIQCGSMCVIPGVCLISNNNRATSAAFAGGIRATECRSSDYVTIVSYSHRR